VRSSKIRREIEATDIKASIINHKVQVKRLTTSHGLEEIAISNNITGATEDNKVTKLE
jgi:hypothetical protein